jgi:hypothetical protein
MPGQDFLATIKLVLDKTGVTSGMSATKGEIESTQIAFPWDRGAEESMKKVETIALDGFAQISRKSTEILGKQGEVIGTRLVTGYRNADGAIRTVTQTIDNQGKVIRQYASDMTKADSSVNQFALSLRRALIVAPVWMVTREVTKQIIDFFKDGMTYMLETDKATNNLTASLYQMGQTGSQAIEGIVKNMKNLSIETGKSTASLINIVANVNRILQDTTKSQIVATEATKLSIETGANAEKLAETMAFLYKLQGDSLKGLTTDTQKFQEISSLLYATQAKTPGGMEKLSSDIRSFAATMSIADFGLENTIRLMGVFESTGVTSGQTLKTGLMKILTNLDDVSKMLGIDLPQSTSSADAFRIVLEKLSSAMQPGYKGTNIYQTLKEIFGGAGGRGALNISALAKDINSVQAALAGTGVTAEERNLQIKQLHDVSLEADYQLGIFKNLKDQLGETFLTGLLGGKDFGTGLKTLNDDLKRMEDMFNKIGKGIRSIAFGEWIKDALPILKLIPNQQTKIEENLNSQLSTETKINAEIEKKNTLITQTNILTKKQADELENLIIRYAKAKPEEREGLRRQIELTQMPPEQQVMAFRQGGKDRDLMMEMTSKLDENVRERMAGIIASEQGIYTHGRFSAFEKGTGEGFLKPGEQPIVINPKGADKIELTVNLGVYGEKLMKGTAEEISKQIEDALLNDEVFKKAFLKDGGKYIQSQ